jgi:hypothetical protein
VSGLDLPKKVEFLLVAVALAVSSANKVLPAALPRPFASPTPAYPSPTPAQSLSIQSGFLDRMGSLFPTVPAVFFVTNQLPSAPSTPLDYVSKIASIADSLIRILAILVGAAFAYWKFFRGRTFHPRLEAGVSAVARVDSGTVFLTVCCKLKNVGLSSVELDRQASAIRVLLTAVASPTSKVREVKWPKSSELTVDVFQQHEWIEGGETVEDSHLFTFPYLADQTGKVELKVVHIQRNLRARLAEWRRRSGRPNSWSQHVILDSFLPKRTCDEHNNNCHERKPHESTAENSSAGP